MSPSAEHEGSFVAKVSDLGLSRFYIEGQTASTNMAGTVPYMDPMYNVTGGYTWASDVFSFGVVVLQVVSGKCNPVEAKKLSSEQPLGITPDDVLLKDVPDTLLQHSDEHIPALKELIGLAQACMSVAPSERPAFGSRGEAEGTIVGRLS